MATAADGGERPCVFLDRDGTLIEDTGYVHLPEQMRILPGVREGLAALRQAGCLLIVVTNQSGVARGFYDEAAVERCHAHLSQQLGAAAAPDVYYYCPFHPEGVRAEYRRASELRKPDIGMYERACAEHAIDRRRSFMIGDKALDMEFARRARLRGVWVGAAGLGTPDEFARAADFAAATASVLSQLRGVRSVAVHGEASRRDYGLFGSVRARVASRAAPLLRRFEPSRMPAAASGPGALRVRLTMPNWTVHRSTDREYVYERFTRLSEHYALEFVPASELRFLIEWNGKYLLRRALQTAHIRAFDQIEAPRQSARGADVAFSYGVFPSRALRVPVVWEHTFAPQLDSDPEAWIASWRARASDLAERASSVVTATAVSAEWFARMFPSAASKVHVVPYYLPDTVAIDDDAFAAKLAPRERVRVLFVGREARRKGLVELTQAWHSLDPQTRSAFEVVVVSAMLDGPVALPDGWQHFRTLPNLRAQFEAAQLFVFPSLREAYGLVLVEAMAAGCMIVTTSAPIQRSIVGAAGAHCDPRDPHAIAAVLRELAADRARLEHGMRAARQRWSAEYAPAGVGARYAQLLWSSAGRSGSPPPIAASV